jgi:Domain of unknown function (DUF4288)
MSWYAAHIVMVVKLKEQPQERYPIWENIVLLDAASDDEAFDRAEQRGPRKATKGERSGGAASRPSGSSPAFARSRPAITAKNGPATGPR